MTSGDDGPANGRVEAEVGQIMRVFLETSKLELQDWPGVARWAGEERLRKQLQKMGVPSKPMVPLGERVVVKTKRWHKQGPLAAPFKSMVLMGPSPNMTNGWVLRDGRKVQHARAVVRPAEAGEKAVMELYDASTRRVTGKRPPYLEDRKVPQPLQHDDLPQLLREDLGLDDSQDVWGEAGIADQGEDALSMGYSPDEFPEDLHQEGGGSVDGEPALRIMWTGGSQTPLQQRRALQQHRLPQRQPQLHDGCGLLQPEMEDCNVCGGSARLSSSSQSGLASLSLEASSTSGSHGAGSTFNVGVYIWPGSHGAGSTSMWVSSQSGLDGLPDLNDMDAQPEHGPAGERAWESVEIHDLEGLVDSVHREHWGWKKLWEQVQELSREAVGAEIGLVHGQFAVFGGSSEEPGGGPAWVNRLYSRHRPHRHIASMGLSIRCLVVTL